MISCDSLGAQKGFPEAPKGLMTLSCSGAYKDNKTVCLKFDT